MWITSNYYLLCWIWGPHSNDYKECGLLPPTYTGFLLVLLSYPENGSILFLRNIEFIPNYTVLQPRKNVYISQYSEKPQTEQNITNLLRSYEGGKQYRSTQQVWAPFLSKKWTDSARQRFTAMRVATIIKIRQQINPSKSSGCYTHQDIYH
jgi:hypothetical protein